MQDPSSATWFGHPRGLATLFFTEMWERFSYYGMRALLVLFMTAAIVDPAGGGLGLNDKVAGAIYGLYTAAVYLLALPGGWIADRLLGQRKAIWYGGIIIASGHFSMAIPTTATFFLGLLLIVFGTGLLKPNISTIVGDLYPEGGARRDAGFSIFYMGINVGAFASPLICGYLGEQINWHLGFGCAGVGMVLGVIQYALTQRSMGDIGVRPSAPLPDAAARKAWAIIFGVVAVVALLFVIGVTGIVAYDPVTLAHGATGVIIGSAVAYFVYALFFAKLNGAEQKRVIAIAILLVACSLFWSGFEQAGSSLNLFGERFTDRDIFGFEMPASWLQSVNALFIIGFAPFFAAMWVWLARRNLEPSSPLKFAFGLIFLGLGFLVMYFASKIVVSGMLNEGEPNLVLPTWLILTYLLHTFGELCLSPVGLSTMTKLAPRMMVGQIMGLWFMATAFGNLIAGLVAGQFEPEAFVARDEAKREAIVFQVDESEIAGAEVFTVLFQGPEHEADYVISHEAPEPETGEEVPAEQAPVQAVVNYRNPPPPDVKDDAKELPNLLAVEVRAEEAGERPRLEQVDGGYRLMAISDGLDHEGDWQAWLLAHGPGVQNFRSEPVALEGVQRNIEEMPGLYMMITMIIVGGGVFMLLLVMPMRSLIPKEE